MSLQSLRSEIQKASNPEKAKLLSRFFKTGKGEYGEGDLFLGIVVPIQRQLVKKYSHLSLEDIEHLIKSKYHEERLIALLLLVHQFEKHPDKRKSIFDFYLENTKYINNWDLVDLTAPKIVGEYLLNKDMENSVILRSNSPDREFETKSKKILCKSILYKLVKSSNLWERRIAVLATFRFIREKQFEDSLKLSELLLKDTHDLMHKAVGWMLREIGKRDVKVLEKFLKKHYKIMPRTMLRYSIEKFPEEKRKDYLNGEI
ncbi:MAG: DNA alkylation repair protein [Nanoarchaeota archaeon]